MLFLSEIIAAQYRFVAFLYYVHVILVASHSTIEEQRLLGPSVCFAALFALDSRMAVTVLRQILRVYNTSLQRLSLLRIQVILRLFVNLDQIIVVSYIW